MVSWAAPGVHKRCLKVLVAEHPDTKRIEELRLDPQERKCAPEDSIWRKLKRLQEKVAGKHFPHLYDISHAIENVFQV